MANSIDNYDTKLGLVQSQLTDLKVIIDQMAAVPNDEKTWAMGNELAYVSIQLSDILGFLANKEA